MMSSNVRGRVGLALWRSIIDLPLGRPAQTPPSVVRDVFGTRSACESIWSNRRISVASYSTTRFSSRDISRVLPSDTAPSRLWFDSHTAQRWQVLRRARDGYRLKEYVSPGLKRDIHSAARLGKDSGMRNNENSTGNQINTQEPPVQPSRQAPQAVLSPNPRPLPEAAKEPTPPAGATKHLRDRLPHVTSHLHRPTKEELLAAATGFWSRLRVRFKWFSIKSARPFNTDDLSAFFSWIIVGHIVWIIIGTTTFFSLAIFMINTVFAQGMLVKLQDLCVGANLIVQRHWLGGLVTISLSHLASRSFSSPLSSRSGKMESYRLRMYSSLEGQGKDSRKSARVRRHRLPPQQRQPRLQRRPKLASRKRKTRTTLSSICPSTR